MIDFHSTAQETNDHNSKIHKSKETVARKLFKTLDCLQQIVCKHETYLTVWVTHSEKMMSPNTCLSNRASKPKSCAGTPSRTSSVSSNRTGGSTTVEPLPSTSITSLAESPAEPFGARCHTPCAGQELDPRRRTFLLPRSGRWTSPLRRLSAGESPARRGGGEGEEDRVR